MSVATADPPAHTGPRHLPGENGIWVFVFGDMLVFTLFFGVTLYYRGEFADVFRQAHAQMSQPLGLFNTLLMLSSSWFVATAVQAARHGRVGVTRATLWQAVACGVGFCVVKYVEYAEKIRAGFTLTSNEFYTLYYMLTGIHLFHVLMGITVLAVLLRRTPRDGRYDALRLRNLEVGASFWHLVDVLWIVLFAIFYLVG